MPIKSEAQKKAVAKYNKNNYEQIQIRVVKGDKAIIQEYADRNGESVNGYINRLIKDDMQKTM